MWLQFHAPVPIRYCIYLIYLLFMCLHPTQFFFFCMLFTGQYNFALSLNDTFSTELLDNSSQKFAEKQKEYCDGVSSHCTWFPIRGFLGFCFSVYFWGCFLGGRWGRPGVWKLCENFKCDWKLKAHWELIDKWWLGEKSNYWREKRPRNYSKWTVTIHYLICKHMFIYYTDSILDSNSMLFSEFLFLLC